MSFFSGLGAGAAALTEKLGGYVQNVTGFIGDNAQQLVGLASQVQQLQAGWNPPKPPKQTVAPGEIPPAGKEVDAPTAVGLPPLAIAGLAVVAVVLLAKGRR